MKKRIALGLLVVVLLGGAGAVTLLWKRTASASVDSATLVPGETLFFAELTDLPRSAVRWRGTELNKLWNEADVQAFMEKPLANYPPLIEARRSSNDLVKLWPRQAFTSVVTLDGKKATMIAGFSYLGSKAAADRLLAPFRQQYRSARPTGRAELTQHGSVEVETYSTESETLAEAFHKGWYLAASSVELLKATLDRLDAGKSMQPALAQDSLYQEAIAGLPKEPDVRCFVRTGVMMDRLAAALEVSQGSGASGLATLRASRALAASSKIDAGQWLDSVFSVAPQSHSGGSSVEGSQTKSGEAGAALGSGAEALPVMTRNALALTTPETVFFSSVPIEGLRGSAVSVDSLKQFIPFVGTMETVLASQGWALTDLPGIFGPEVAVVVPRAQITSFSAVVAAEVRDEKRAQALVEALTSPSLGASAWSTEKGEGLTLCTAPADAQASFTPVLGIVDGFWLLGLNTGGITDVAHRPDGAVRLDESPGFRQVAERVSPPSLLFGYVDLGRLFQASYPLARTLLAFSAAGGPEAGKYADFGKLPSAQVIAPHLGSTVLSETSTAGGRLWELRGNITPLPAVLVGALGYYGAGAPDLPSLPAGVLPANLSTLFRPPSSTPTPEPSAPKENAGPN